MFYTIADLVEQAQAYDSVSDLMVATEMEVTGRKKEQIIALMERNLSVMENSVAEGVAGVKSVTGLTGGDAKKMNDYLNSGNFLSGETILTAVRNGIAVNEVNAKMGLICATPTAGSAGVVAGVLLAVRNRLNLTHEEQINFLFTAGAFGLVIANNASISGAEGGCQAEVGSASAMAAAALVCANGGTAHQAAQAVAITLKNMMGLICDPVAGLVEVPCVKRNALGSSQAFISADMALAGIESVIPPDEVVAAMYQVGRQMPSIFKETAEGGLAMTPTAQRLQKEIFAKQE
ncbi:MULTISPECIES: L-serine ammonia-lyase, iron-sulfur-dependent, subunit alpha [Enterococcus]|mgnify:CR=1 FL=1|jgi:L-serine dehydratase|uniref:L-serine dehydratase n=1 Tax=Enterococcus dispar ATCC 51266 TaxID=1139219 RepID=S0KXH5_9ENTE|nr:L-serine ammonia-lyase, iron-sulfur-dependent, subunit alpha [Enterococcus dispar]EOT43936.1 L-serine dehydratase, iron-sulfur-dependent, alpha subunit [Enterococcus dispar ATCC 51266]EOW85807.1 L-serine dehydratase, iron-sulfur-dependent, alpha subunit [Enterococcus dispar ATCC 51266]MCU7357958.1 L-serine ammonia-lyase, iron-sulfur-dependent, subunit alpha [Enterococcus dispar]MDT2705460.1 L-serine ammonia-lyase, iron-sulfur-dependent, subunit alpha [Enterococcus dispar]OJG38982.1 L-serine